MTKEQEIRKSGLTVALEDLDGPLGVAKCNLARAKDTEFLIDEDAHGAAVRRMAVLGHLMVAHRAARELADKIHLVIDQMTDAASAG